MLHRVIGNLLYVVTAVIFILAWIYTLGYFAVVKFQWMVLPFEFTWTETGVNICRAVPFIMVFLMWLRYKIDN